MSECPICDEVKKPLFKVENIAVYIPEKPANAMHMIVTTAKHHTILEEVTDEDVGKLFTVANLMSAALFAKSGAAGTNLILQNGIPAGQKQPHLIINVIGRTEGDGLDFSWAPKEVSEDELSTIEFQLKEGAETAPETPQQVVPEPKTEKIVTKKKEKNYLLDQLDRKP